MTKRKGMILVYSNGTKRDDRKRYNTGTKRYFNTSDQPYIGTGIKRFKDGSLGNLTPDQTKSISGSIASIGDQIGNIPIQQPTVPQGIKPEEGDVAQAEKKGKAGKGLKIGGGFLTAIGGILAPFTAGGSLALSGLGTSMIATGKGLESSQAQTAKQAIATGDRIGPGYADMWKQKMASQITKPQLPQLAAKGGMIRKYADGTMPPQGQQHAALATQKDESGVTHGPGGPKDDAVPAQLDGGFVVPAEYREVFFSSGVAEQLGIDPSDRADQNQSGGEEVRLSPGEVYISEEKVAMAEQMGIDLQQFAPNATEPPPGEQAAAHGGKVYQDGTDQSARRDSVEHGVGRIMDFERDMGSAEGKGLANYGNPDLSAGATKAQAISWAMDNLYPKIQEAGYKNATEEVAAMDFMYNTGKHLKNYGIDQLKKSMGLMGLTSEQRKSDEFLDFEVMPHSTSKERMDVYNKGRDYYYKNINNPSPGVPNPAYDNTWKHRITNTSKVNLYSDYVPEERSVDVNTVPVDTSAKQKIDMSQFGYKKGGRVKSYSNGVSTGAVEPIFGGWQPQGQFSLQKKDPNAAVRRSDFSQFQTPVWSPGQVQQPNTAMQERLAQVGSNPQMQFADPYVNPDGYVQDENENHRNNIFKRGIDAFKANRQRVAEMPDDERAMRMSRGLSIADTALQSGMLIHNIAQKREPLSMPDRFVPAHYNDKLDLAPIYEKIGRVSNRSFLQGIHSGLNPNQTLQAAHANELDQKAQVGMAASQYEADIWNKNVDADNQARAKYIDDVYKAKVADSLAEEDFKRQKGDAVAQNLNTIGQTWGNHVQHKLDLMNANDAQLENEVLALSSGYYGLKDMSAAKRWLRANKGASKEDFAKEFGLTKIG